MVSFLIDTNVLFELRKGQRADPGVRAWFEAADDKDLYTSVLVLGEIRCGVESIRRRDPAGAAALDQWGALNVPDRVPTLDGLLAATALVHDMTVVTRNARDFRRTGVKVENPFSE